MEQFGIDTLEVIAHLVETKESSITVKVVNVAKQSGAKDCALYAIATIACLVQQIDPSTVILHQVELRPNLVKILETGELTSFPVIKHIGDQLVEF